MTAHTPADDLADLARRQPKLRLQFQDKMTMNDLVETYDALDMPIGQNPRNLSAAQLEAAGKPRISRGEAIRAKCLDCCCGNRAEVRRCAIADCALWAFRLGDDPYRQHRPLTIEQRAAITARLKLGRTGGK